MTYMLRLAIVEVKKVIVFKFGLLMRANLAF